MIVRTTKIFSSQAQDIYNLLLDGQALTAKEIANKLQILSNAVYRSVKQLQALGFVCSDNKYPVKYQIVSQSDALEQYLVSIRQYIQNKFPFKNAQNSKLLDISFIRNRDELRKKTDFDVTRSKQSVDFIVSGLEVPAETILIYKQAIDLGVKVRVIVQRLDDTSKKMFYSWKTIGVNVKYYPNMEARIFIIDQEIIYFTSYDSDVKNEAIGMRFKYTPYAKLMTDLFESRWRQAKDI